MNTRYIPVITMILAFIAAALFASGMVLAHHYRFFAEEKRKQLPDNSGLIKNHISVHWAITPGSSSDTTNPTRFFFDSENSETPNPASIFTPNANLVRTAVSAWQTAVPGPRWHNETSDKNNADVFVIFAECDLDFSGSFLVKDPTEEDLARQIDEGWEVNIDRQARYWKRAIICISSTKIWQNNAAILSVISHERCETARMDCV